MTLVKRLIRFCKADAHGIMDGIEDKGLLLKQSIREMETCLRSDAAMLDQTRTAHARAFETHSAREKALEQLTADVDAAIEKQRDDIARMLIKKEQRMQRVQAELTYRLEQCASEAERLQERVDDRRHALEKIKLQAAAYFRHQEMSADTMDEVPADIYSEPTAAEIELELLRRKAAFKGGGA